ncbi:hypothetical protein D1AOALGA4SA_1049 [Olavius algarvensis Delta 1 endosymbiont]|nr:hypothetical protein D1AOALGA4SA_1049 [Olavius algarvensis Delta 1 endosymbiont]
MKDYENGHKRFTVPNVESFGLTRLKEVLDANSEVPFPALKSAVLQELHEFAEKGLTYDDMTLIAMEIVEFIQYAAIAMSDWEPGPLPQKIPPNLNWKTLIV